MRTMIAVGLGLVLAGPACAADLPAHRLRAVRVRPVPVANGPVPFVVAVPAPPLAYVHVPVPDSFFPFFEPAPPPLPSRTIFSAPVAYPIPQRHPQGPVASDDDAENLHYGYGQDAQPQLPLGYYGPNSLD